MKNKLIYLLPLLCVILAITSCEKEESDQESTSPSASTGANNFDDLAVTGGLNYVSYTCAEIIGYVNLGPFALAGVEFGIIISRADDSTPDENHGKKLRAHSLQDERKFIICASRSDGLVLSSDTEYKYRTYVKAADTYILGEILTFKTLAVPDNIIEAFDISSEDIECHRVTIRGKYDTKLLYRPKEDWKIDVYFDADNDYYDKYYDCGGYRSLEGEGKTLGKGEFEIYIGNLKDNLTYNFQIRIHIGGSIFEVDKKSFTTKTLKNDIGLDLKYNEKALQWEMAIISSKFGNMDHKFHIGYMSDEYFYYFDTGEENNVIEYNEDKGIYEIPLFIAVDPQDLAYYLRYWAFVQKYAYMMERGEELSEAEYNEYWHCVNKVKPGVNACKNIPLRIKVVVDGQSCVLKHLVGNQVLNI